jgi:hypothetical protein
MSASCDIARTLWPDAIIAQIASAFASVYADGLPIGFALTLHYDARLELDFQMSRAVGLDPGRSANSASCLGAVQHCAEHFDRGDLLTGEAV